MYQVDPTTGTSIIRLPARYDGAIIRYEWRLPFCNLLTLASRCYDYNISKLSPNIKGGTGDANILTTLFRAIPLGIWADYENALESMTQTKIPYYAKSYRIEGELVDREAGGGVIVRRLTEAEQKQAKDAINTLLSFFRRLTDSNGTVYTHTKYAEPAVWIKQLLALAPKMFETTQSIGPYLQSPVLTVRPSKKESILDGQRLYDDELASELGAFLFAQDLSDIDPNFVRVLEGDPDMGDTTFKSPEGPARAAAIAANRVIRLVQCYKEQYIHCNLGVYATPLAVALKSDTRSEIDYAAATLKRVESELAQLKGDSPVSPWPDMLQRLMTSMTVQLPDGSGKAVPLPPVIFDALAKVHNGDLTELDVLKTDRRNYVADTSELRRVVPWIRALIDGYGGPRSERTDEALFVTLLSDAISKRAAHLAERNRKIDKVLPWGRKIPTPSKVEFSYHTRVWGWTDGTTTSVPAIDVVYGHTFLLPLGSVTRNARRFKLVAANMPQEWSVLPVPVLRPDYQTARTYARMSDTPDGSPSVVKIQNLPRMYVPLWAYLGEEAVMVVGFKELLADLQARYPRTAPEEIQRIAILIAGLRSNQNAPLVTNSQVVLLPNEQGNVWHGRETGLKGDMDFPDSTNLGQLFAKAKDETFDVNDVSPNKLVDLSSEKANSLVYMRREGDDTYLDRVPMLMQNVDKSNYISLIGSQVQATAAPQEDFQRLTIGEPPVPTFDVTSVADIALDFARVR